MGSVLDFLQPFQVSRRGNQSGCTERGETRNDLSIGYERRHSMWEANESPLHRLPSVLRHHIGKKRTWLAPGWRSRSVRGQVRRCSQQWAGIVAADGYATTKSAGWNSAKA